MMSETTSHASGRAEPEVKALEQETPEKKMLEMLEEDALQEETLVLMTLGGSSERGPSEQSSDRRAWEPLGMEAESLERGTSGLPGERETTQPALAKQVRESA